MGYRVLTITKAVTFERLAFTMHKPSLLLHHNKVINRPNLFMQWRTLRIIRGLLTASTMVYLFNFLRKFTDV